MRYRCPRRVPADVLLTIVVKIGTFANLGAQRFYRESFAKVTEGPVPTFNMELVGIDQSTIDVENESAQFCAKQARCPLR